MAQRIMLLPAEQEFIPTPKKSEFDAFIELLPKNMQRKASVLVHSIQNYIDMDDNGRIIYEDGSVGSSVFDHIRYWISNQGKEGIRRPVDFEQFAKLLRDKGVPKSAIAKDKQHFLDSVQKWKKLY